MSEHGPCQYPARSQAQALRAASTNWLSEALCKPVHFKPQSSTFQNAYKAVEAWCLHGRQLHTHNSKGS